MPFPVNLSVFFQPSASILSSQSSYLLCPVFVQTPVRIRPRLVLLAISHGQPQHEVDNNSGEQRQRKDSRTEPIIETTLAPHPYALRAPVEREKGVDHCHHSDSCEQASTDLADPVTEVEKANGQSAEDNGEVQP